MGASLLETRNHIEDGRTKKYFNEQGCARLTETFRSGPQRHRLLSWKAPNGLECRTLTPDP